tara:strand:- start:375 stop:767 length:393 start_codon:yes stop_codon:yes gene_type:complete
MNLIIFCLLTVSLTILSSKPKNDSKSLTNKLKIILRKDNRKSLAIGICAFYFALLFFIDVSMNSITGLENTPIIVAEKLGLLIPLCIISSLVPYLISLIYQIFQKDKIGLAFNVSAIALNYWGLIIFFNY